MQPGRKQLIRVRGSWFTAGALIEETDRGWVCVKAAPILRWIMKKEISEILKLFKEKRLTYEKIGKPYR